jgi:hypothetical protein
MRKQGKVLVLTILLLTALAGQSLRAEWTENGIDITTEIGGQIWPVIVSDGSGGAIVAWADERGPQLDIYAQRVDEAGDVLWTVNGIGVCTDTMIQWYPEIVSDGAGGAIIAWIDFRDLPANPSIYAQRIDASGGSLWTTNGIAVCTGVLDVGGNMHLRSIPDGSGGAIIVWEDGRSIGIVDYHIYAQRIDASGTVLWTVDGVAIQNLENSGGRDPVLVSDGAGGAIIAWQDARHPSSGIYAQRVNASGTVLWTANGVPVLSITGGQHVKIESDSAGGAIIAWTDYRNGLSESDIYAQRLDASGNALWAVNGIPVSAAAEYQQLGEIVTDASGGAMMVWMDHRSGTEYDIYAQRVDPLGNMLWTTDGTAICTEVNDQGAAEIVSDGCGGAYIVWIDGRGGTTPRELFAQRIDALGNIHWVEDGLPVSGVQMENPYYSGTTYDGLDGVITTWQYDDGVTGNNIYAQRFDFNGKWGNNAPVITEVLDVPADQGGAVTVTWLASALDVSPEVTITRYSLWRRLPGEDAAAMFLALESNNTNWTTLLSTGKLCNSLFDIEAAPVYRFTQTAGMTYGWELILYRDADYSTIYTDTSATLFDSTDATTGMHHFMVTAHTAHQWTFWDSAPDSGYSKDNIPPSMPSGASARQSYDPEGLELKWNRNTEPDFRYYRVYRGRGGETVTHRMLLVSGDSLLTSTSDTTYFDSEWRWYENFYYKIASVDIHGNESETDSIGRGEVTGDDPPITPQVAFLAQNVPNPFNPNTTIRFGLHESGYVTLRIYDVAGRFVHALIEEQRAAGIYTEIWNGVDSHGRAAASGVYFYRLVAGDFVQTKKMVLLR